MIKLLTFSLLFASTISFAQQAMFDICPIKTSDSIPESMIFRDNGESVNLKNYINEKPTIIVFYRGGWCPYCMRHLSALNDIKTQIDSLGFELIAITPDDFTKLDTSVVRSDNSDYTLFSDKDKNAITDFGIGWEVSDSLYSKYKNDYGMDLEWWSKSTKHILPVPAVFIVKNGVIQFQHVDPNYSKRLSADLLLALIKSL
jgi:peroxiredoxin